MPASQNPNQPIGAGPDISVGRMIRALTAARAIKNTRTIKAGAIFCRKKVMVILVNVSLNWEFELGVRFYRIAPIARPIASPE
jgi:hypothetical protein